MFPHEQLRTIKNQMKTMERMSQLEGRLCLSFGLSVSECTDLNQMSRVFNEIW